ncbi:long-chain-fatty-acid--CoA ligase [Caballeronia terrestris]|uniref:Long-chain-fatty-acid--CoA ligase n=1 Tax=Caballeronia terrestris TaxID=1226301 RepID=A0A158FL01_9BURK|nr:AMP-binding protein [Caballeronia terrestris]SAL20435.1 long-chain-fatty-acid--CoA ligase [Caballeronia terrestris]
MNTPTTLRALIDERARQFPDKPFLLGPAEDGGIDVLTFGQLRDACGTLAARFTDAGLNPGDVISVYMGNGLQTATLLLAAMYGGYVANPMNLLCQPSQVRYIVEHSDTRAIFVSRDSRESIDAALAELRAQGFERELRVIETHPDTVAHAQPAFAGEGAEAERPRLEQSNVTLLMYTSGTTGAPKGVLLTHRNLLANARNITAEHRLGSDDRVLASLPLYHINGLVVTLIAPLFHGGSVVMAARFSARTFWRDVARHRCTWINVVPTIVAYLLDRDERDPHDTFDLAALRFCRSASAALPAEHHRAFEARFHVGVIETMGMTETAAPAFSNPYDTARRRIGSIGLPSGGEARVIDTEGRDCAPNECGEIVLRGEQVTRGYYKRPEETRAAFTADGWLRTGDLGFRDADGYFYINGRAKELIIKGGENIAPREIDEALLRHPGVLEAAAVGVPDAAYGQEIVAFVVAREAGGANPLDAAALRDHCLRELGRYKTPKEFRLVTELPRGPSGKVQRLKLLQT